MMSDATEEQTRLLDAAVVAGGLGARYTQTHRAYHNLMHIEDVLLRIEELTPPQRARAFAGARCMVSRCRVSA